MWLSQSGHALAALGEEREVFSVHEDELKGQLQVWESSAFIGSTWVTTYFIEGTWHKGICNTGFCLLCVRLCRHTHQLHTCFSSPRVPAAVYLWCGSVVASPHGPQEPFLLVLCPVTVPSSLICVPYGPYGLQLLSYSSKAHQCQWKLQSILHSGIYFGINKNPGTITASLVHWLMYYYCVFTAQHTYQRMILLFTERKAALWRISSSPGKLFQLSCSHQGLRLNSWRVAWQRNAHY